MSEEKKQRTDDKSVELGSVLQLAPHTPSTREQAVEKPEDGKGFISLDEVYENGGLEAFSILGNNCKQLMDYKRLSASGMTVLKLDGCENFMPGYDRQNAIMGGEGFVDSLKKGFVIVIKAIKAMIIKILDWVVGKVRVMLGFEKTEKELAIVAEKTEEAQGSLSRILTKITEGVDFKWDFKAFYADLPDNVTSGELFNIVYARNRNTKEQIEKLSQSKALIAEANRVLMSAGQTARRARSIYKEAVANLRIAFEGGNFSQADVIKFRNTLESEVASSLNPTEMNKITERLLNEIYNLDLKGTGIDSTIKGQMEKLRQEVAQTKPFVINPEMVNNIMNLKKNLVNVMAGQAATRYDPEEMKLLKDLISVKDAELLEVMSTKTAETGYLQMGYTQYSAIISEFVQRADLLSSILAQVKKTLASLVKWTNDVDKVMLAYVAGDVSKIIAAQAEVMGDKAKDLYHEGTNKPNTIVDYDKLFIARHPKFSAAVTVWRAEGANFYKKYAGAFREVNKLLASIGVRTI